MRALLCFIVLIIYTGGCYKSPASSVQSPSIKEKEQTGTSGSVDPIAASQSSTEAEQSTAIFRDVTRASGVDFSYSSGRSANEFAILESIGGGVGILDFDRDGLSDLFFVGGGTLNDKTVQASPNGLFRNLAQMQFQAVTTPALALTNQHFTNGISVADFDADGFQDLAISGYGAVQLLRNQGDGTFTALPSLITSDAVAWSSSLAWADLNNNAHLDLYVTHYVDWSWNNHPSCRGQGNVPREVCPPRDFSGISDVVYFNDGQSFVAQSDAIGLEPGGKGLGVALCDLNGDHFIDIYVANDTTENRLYFNNGAGEFSSASMLAGVAGDETGVSNGSMGVSILDANGDLKPDIFVTNFEREMSALYLNQADGFFTYASRKSGFGAYPAEFVGFGTAVLDFNFDGAQDLVVANGHVWYASAHSPFRQKPLAFKNVGGQFERQAEEDYFAIPHTGRGLAASDLDNDGAVDLVFSNLEEPVSVVQAVPPVVAAWAIVRLVGVRSNRDAVGASLDWQPAGGPRQKFHICGGGSYLSHSDQRIHLYWPAGSSDASQPLHVDVQWPSVEIERFSIQPTKENTLVQGEGRIVSVD